MVSDYFNYDVDSLDYIISDLELDHSSSDEWPLMSFNNPSCVTVSDIFSEEEIGKIIFTGKQSGSNLGTVASHNEFVVDSDVRRSKVSWLKPNSFNSWLYEKLTRIICEVNDSNWEYDLRSIQTLQFGEYHSEYQGHYRQHLDANLGNNVNTTQRKLSFSVQLSHPNDYRGGDLLLNNGAELISKNKGSMTLFPSHTLHEVTPVTKGVRYSLVGWVIGDKLK